MGAKGWPGCKAFTRPRTGWFIPFHRTSSNGLCFRLQPADSVDRIVRILSQISKFLNRFRGPRDPDNCASRGANTFIPPPPGQICIRRLHDGVAVFGKYWILDSKIVRLIRSKRDCYFFLPVSDRLHVLYFVNFVSLYAHERRIIVLVLKKDGIFEILENTNMFIGHSGGL